MHGRDGHHGHISAWEESSEKNSDILCAHNLVSGEECGHWRIIESHQRVDVQSFLQNDRPSSLFIRGKQEEDTFKGLCNVVGDELVFDGAA